MKGDLLIWRCVAAIVVAAVVALGAADKEHVAERFDVKAAVLPDGSLEVDETIAFRFTGGTFTAVTRELRAAESDGIHIVDALMDGRPMPRGGEEGQVEIDAGRERTRVEWHFAPAVDRVHTFTLRYRYAAVVRQGDGEDWFRWRPFPDRFDYPIEAGSATVTWPANATLRRMPDVEGAAAATSPSADGRGFAVTVANYRERDDNVRLTIRFHAGAFAGPEPVWQRDARRADRLAPAFMAACAMILAACGLALWLFFLRFRRDGSDPPPAAGTVTTPPGDLTPALGGTITGGRVSISWPQLFAVVFDLARRGVLQIDEPADGGLLRKRRFRLARGGAEPTRPHEQAVLDALFKDGAREERFDRALRRLGTRAGKVKRAMQGELASAGLIDADRKEGGKALAISGGVLMAVALAAAFALAATGMRLGEASLFLPLGFFVAGLLMLIIGASFSTLTRSGLRSARQWDAYRRHLKGEIKQGRVPHEGEAIGRLLPYAAALGVLAPFGKALSKVEVRNLPQWLRTLDAAGNPGAAMIAIITAGSQSMSHGASGGAGGGGVGGGSSSAH